MRLPFTFTKCACHLQAVGHSKTWCEETVFDKMWNVTHILFNIIWKDVMRSWDCLTQNLCNVTHKLFKVIGKDAMRLTFTKCAVSLTSCCQLVIVGKDVTHGTAFHKMCNVTHSLLVIGKDVIKKRLPFTSHNVQCHSQTVGHRKMWSDCHSQNMQCHRLADGHRNRRFDETGFHKKCVMSLTNCWSYGRMWWNCHLSQNVQCHSLPVDYRERCDETAFHKMCNITHKLLVIAGKDVMRLVF